MSTWHKPAYEGLVIRRSLVMDGSHSLPGTTPTSWLTRVFHWSKVCKSYPGFSLNRAAASQSSLTDTDMKKRLNTNMIDRHASQRSAGMFGM